MSVQKSIRLGSWFTTNQRTGKPLAQSTVARKIRALGKAAGVQVKVRFAQAA